MRWDCLFKVLWYFYFWSLLKSSVPAVICWNWWKNNVIFRFNSVYACNAIPPWLLRTTNKSFYICKIFFCAKEAIYEINCCQVYWCFDTSGGTNVTDHYWRHCFTLIIQLYISNFMIIVTAALELQEIWVCVKFDVPQKIFKWSKEHIVASMEHLAFWLRFKSSRVNMISVTTLHIKLVTNLTFFFFLHQFFFILNFGVYLVYIHVFRFKLNNKYIFSKWSKTFWLHCMLFKIALWQPVKHSILIAFLNAFYVIPAFKYSFCKV